MFKAGRSIKSILIATLFLALLANGAQAADPIRQYQIDVVPIANPGVTIEVTEEVSRQMVKQVDGLLLESKRTTIGDNVMIVAGSPPGIPGSTNAMRVHRMGDAVGGVAPAYR